MLEKVKETVAEALGADIDTITAETSFKEDLGADSLDLFEMVMSLEDTCGVEIPTEDLETTATQRSRPRTSAWRRWTCCIRTDRTRKWLMRTRSAR